MAAPASAVRLVGLARGVRDPGRSAQFFGWLLGLTPERDGDDFVLSCGNGELRLHPDTTTAVGIHLATGRTFEDRDPDGVPVDGVESPRAEAGPLLDHASLMCSDLGASVAFYRDLGLVVTWSASGEVITDGLQHGPVAHADWVHVSGEDGYLSLSQADWADYGTHNAAAGPPRFVHIGFAVTDLSTIIDRLELAGTPYQHAPPDPVGDRLYLNDPDGDPRLGNNIELTAYVPRLFRSGRPADAS